MDKEVKGNQEDLVISDGNMDNGNTINNGHGICFIESLPIEVLSLTVDFTLTGSPRIIVDTYNSLCALNTHFHPTFRGY